MPNKQLNIWRKYLPEVVYANLYGPTEITDACTYYIVDREFKDDESLPIGIPMKNTEIMVLDDENHLVTEPGVVGELCVRGTGVATGYYKNPEKTAQAFVQNPLNNAYPELIYRTGDIAMRNERGELIFVSRKDYQIKHMGHRIELGEIEANVSALEGIQICACIYSKTDEKIVLYYVGDKDKATVAKELRDRLPRYMIPNEFEVLEQMLFTPNGKIDRKALLAKYEETCASE